MSEKQNYLSKLEALRTRIKGFLLFQGIVYLLCSLLVLVLVDMGLDRLFRLDVAQRLLLTLLLAGGLAYIAIKHLFGPMGITLSDEKVAVLVENRYPDLGDRLISSLQFDRMIAAGRPISKLLASRVQEQAAQIAGKLEIRNLMNNQRFSYLLMFGAGVLLLGGVAGATIDRETWSTWAQRNLLFSSEAEWPYNTMIEIKGFDKDHRAKVPQGEAFTLEIEAKRHSPDGLREYEIPETVEITYRFGNGEERTVEPTAQPKGSGYFRYPLGALFREVELTVKAGDYTSPPHYITIASRPDLEETTLAIEPPAYTLGPNDSKTRTHTAAGTVAVPHGSQVMLSGRSSKALDKVRVYRGGKEITGVEVFDQTRFKVPLSADSPRAPGNIKVVLLDQEQVTNRSAALFTLAVEPDGLPAIRARPVGIGDRITRWARIPFEVEIKDKYGIGKIRVRYELHRKGRKAKDGRKVEKGLMEVESNPRPGKKRFPRQRIHLDLEQEFEKLRMVDPQVAKPAEGDRVRVWIEASDYGGTDRLQSFPEQGFHFQIVPDTVLSKALLSKQKRIRRQYSALLEREKTIHWLQLKIKNNAETAFEDAAQVKAFFDKFDTNSDQKITRKEFTNRAKFESMDKDKDGALTASDFANLTKWSIDETTAELLDKQGTEQRRILRAALRLATALIQIREEMQNNRLDRDGRSAAKLMENVIRPMKQLADEQMNDLAAKLERIARKLGQQPVDDLDKTIVINEDIMIKMAEILKQMVWSELFDDVVTRLRTIIQLEIELERLTKEKRRREEEAALRGILEDDKKKKDE